MSLQMFVKQFGHKLLSLRNLKECVNKRTLNNNKLITRSIHKSSVGHSYEGDGKTTVTIVNKDYSGYLLVDAYSSLGFRLSNGLFAFGPIALFPATILQWNIANAQEINEKSLSLFYLLEPRIEVLVIGVGDENVKIDPKLRLFLSNQNINCEILSTKHAVTTYNFLNTDHRVCAGAFIPPSYADIDPDEDPFLMDAKNRFIVSGKSVLE